MSAENRTSLVIRIKNKTYGKNTSLVISIKNKTLLPLVLRISVFIYKL